MAVIGESQMSRFDLLVHVCTGVLFHQVAPEKIEMSDRQLLSQRVLASYWVWFGLLVRAPCFTLTEYSCGLLQTSVALARGG